MVKVPDGREVQGSLSYLSLLSSESYLRSKEHKARSKEHPRLPTAFAEAMALRKLRRIRWRASPGKIVPEDISRGKQDFGFLIDLQRNDVLHKMEILIAVKKEKVVLQSNLRDQAVNGAPYGQPPFTAPEKYARCLGERGNWVFGLKKSLGFEVTSQQAVLFF